jgi:hypothetical protein
LASLPAIAVTSLIGYKVIPATLNVTLTLGVGLVVLDRLGWRATSATFDRGRLITGTK